MCIPSLRDFALLSHFFCKKVFIHFTGFCSQDWNMVLCCRKFGTQSSWVRSPCLIDKPLHANDKGRARGRTLEPELECGNKTVKIQIENQAKTKLSKITTATASESCLLNSRAQFSIQPKNYVVQFWSRLLKVRNFSFQIVQQCDRPQECHK